MEAGTGESARRSPGNGLTPLLVVGLPRSVGGDIHLERYHVRKHPGLVVFEPYVFVVPGK